MPRPVIETALVVGGGIAGLAATRALRQVGIEAIAVERAPVLGEVGAGIALWPNATDALERLGVLPAVAAASGPVSRVAIMTPGGRVLFRVDPTGYPTPALCIARPALIEALAPPAEALRLGTALVGFDQDDAGIRARFSDGSEATADLLVGADGGRSVVREALFSDGPPAYRGQTVVRGLAPRVGPPGVASETWGDGLRVGLFDVGGGQAYWYIVETRPAASWSAEVDLEALRARVAGWHAPIGETLAGAAAAVRHGVFDRPALRAWHRGRAVLVGDAAHAMTPDLGQGGAVALEDAVALAACLSSAATVAEALGAFERARRARAARIAWQSRWAGRLGQAGGGAGRVRNAVSRAVPSAAFARGFSWAFGAARV